jgi:hypothetical protein
MTLQECIDRHHAVQPDPITLTPLGRAEVAARRLARLLPDLDDQGQRVAVMLAPLSELARLNAGASQTA